MLRVAPGSAGRRPGATPLRRRKFNVSKAIAFSSAASRTSGSARWVRLRNVRSIASTLGLTVEEKRSHEPVTFNEWLHVQAFNGAEKVISAGGTFFGSPNNPRIVRLYSTPVEIPISGILLLLTNKDRPGIVGHLGTLLSKHNVNIANMSLNRDVAGGHALTVLSLDSEPPAAVLAELEKDPDISDVKVVKL